MSDRAYRTFAIALALIALLTAGSCAYYGIDCQRRGGEPVLNVFALPVCVAPR